MSPVGGDRWQSKALFLTIVDIRLSIVLTLFYCRLSGVITERERISVGGHRCFRPDCAISIREKSLKLEAKFQGVDPNFLEKTKEAVQA